VFQSTGTLRYSADYRLVVEVCDGLAAYYRSMIPKCYPVQRPRWDAHITVVRSMKETPPITALWGKYEGETVTFNYEPEIRIDKTYYWLNVWCDRLAKIRTELGLPPKSRWTMPPDAHECFHVTVANRKQSNGKKEETE
jgi:hypothetical protein